MGLSVESQERLDALHSSRADYAYRGRDLGERSIMLFVAGSQSGKSTIINEMKSLSASRGSDVKEVGTHTTRPRKPGDPTNYVTDVTHETMIEDIEQGVPINWSYLEKTGDIYATYPDSLEGEYNLLPTLPSSIPMILRSGLKVQTVYVMPHADDWRARFDEPITDKRIYGRVRETLDSLDYVMKNPDQIEIIKIVNHPGDASLRKLAGALLDICIAGSDWRKDAALDASLIDDFDAHGSTMYRAAMEMIDTAKVVQ